MEDRQMPSMRKRMSAAAIMMIVALTAACASAGPEETGAAGAADGMSVITVQNNHTSRRDMHIYLEPEGRGERVQLGMVRTGETGNFNHDVPRGFYRLVAGSEMGDVRSPRFNVQGPSTVSWVMASARLTVRRR
jgi:hypothetical protein